MERVHSLSLAKHAGERVRVAGWLHSIRKLGGIQFVVVRDAAGLVQAVADEAALAPLSRAGARVESVVEVEGVVKAEPQAPGGFELTEPVITLLSAVTEPTPMALGKKELRAPLPQILDHATLANRHPTRRAIFRLGAVAMGAFRAGLDARDFVEIQSPKLVEGATEGGANVFEVKYFDRTAYLAQSPQFYKQIMVGVFERVYEVGPVFRAEPHDTVRHINQYTSLDVEMGFINTHFDVMRLLTEVVRGMVETLGARCEAELSLLGATLPVVPAEIPHVFFGDAQERIAAAVGAHERGQPDLSPEGERWLGRWAKEELGSDFLFVTGYPMSKRPFYTHPDPERPAHSRSFDLLFRGTELVTGGQRLHEHAAYLAALESRGLSPEPFAKYLETFQFGMPPHGGFAIGLERLLMQLLALPNIRLATLFPRDLTRLSP